MNYDIVNGYGLSYALIRNIKHLKRFNYKPIKVLRRYNSIKLTVQ